MSAKIYKQSYNFLAIFILILSGVIIYSNTFRNSFHFDDIHSIADNPAIRNIWNLRAIWDFWPTRFITYLSIALNYSLSKLNVFGYHLFNLAIHLSSTILVWWFVLLTISTPVMKDKKITKHAHLVAFLTALIFLTHPIQTQGVTYIIQRAVSLASLFYLACLSLYVKSRLLQQQDKSLIASRLFYCGSFITAVMAMFTKEMTITLPLMILLYEFSFLKHKGSLNWKYLIPFLLILAVIPLTMLLTKSVNFGEMRRAAESAPTISSWHYFLTQFRVMVTYVRLTFLPLNQNLDYDYPIAESVLSLPVLASLLFLVTIIIIAFRLFRNHRLISFGIFFFFLVLLPESSIIPIQDVIYEHRLYLPMVGFSLFLVSGIYRIFENKTLKPMVLVLLVITSCYSVLTYRRNFIWKDELTLWDYTVNKSPHKTRPYLNRGNAYDTKGSHDQAISDYNKAIELKPDYAQAYYNRGFAYYAKDNYDQAISDYNKAIELKPDYAQAYLNRGNVYDDKGSHDQAISDYNKAIELKPDYAKAYNNRGFVYYAKGNHDQAISDYNKAIELKPDYAQAYLNRGNAYYAKGSHAQAISDYNKATEINPDYAKAYNNRAIAYYFKQEYAKARDDAYKAEGLGFKVNPDFLEHLKKTSGRAK